MDSLTVLSKCPIKCQQIWKSTFCIHLKPEAMFTTVQNPQNFKMILFKKESKNPQWSLNWGNVFILNNFFDLRVRYKCSCWFIFFWLINKIVSLQKCVQCVTVHNSDVFCLWFQLKARDVAGQALSFIQDLVAALLNFHSYTEQRVHIYPRDSSIEPISPLNQKVRHSYTSETEGAYELTHVQ